jgi:hypothetical protein
MRVKLVAERQPGVTTEIELAGIERDAQAGLADLGLSLAEAKQRNVSTALGSWPDGVDGQGCSTLPNDGE